ncbi:hypothetical protein SteCoe_38714 [Stentor coeruleus]|uniref:Uncharacterized protein n=1 Tax=Stentor coeruleus TaxID=5963 RepID=A0A1R2AL51_9CILI|nr:hypothetical protein SteCoe_38714 [Stentor coeruleus]
MREEYMLTDHNSYVACVSFSQDGRFLASGSYDKLIKIWNFIKKREECTLTGHKETVTSLSFSPECMLLASGLWDGLIKMWNIAEKKEEYTLTGHSEKVTSMSFSPDGRFLASGSEDKLIKIWNLAEKREECTLTGHSGIVSSVSFSPDGRFLASGSYDKLIKIWNLAEKREECTIPIDPGLIETIKFSSDSKLIIVKFESGSIKSYSVSSGIIIDSHNYIPSNISRKYMCFDPLSLSSGIQNYMSWLFTLFQLSVKEYEKIKNTYITFSNLKYSVVHFMAVLGNTSFFQEIIETKKTLLLYDAFGHSPIYYSIKCKYQDITDLLLKNICNLVEEEQNSYAFYLSLKEMGNDLPLIIRNSSSKLDYFLSQIFMYQTERIYCESPKKSYQ